MNKTLARQSGLSVVLVIAGTAMLMMPATAATPSQLLRQRVGSHSAIAQGSTLPLEAGVTVTGQLEDSSPTLEEDGTPYSSHTFEGKAGEQIALLLSSQAFDAYLILLGADGQKIAADDDSGGGMDALVVMTLPANGTYTVVAISVGHEARGEYRLRWRAATADDQALAQAGKLAQEYIQLNEQGRYAEAIPPAEQALELRRQVWGETHPTVVTNLNNLASLYQDQGRYSEAEPLYQQALKILQATLGETHPTVATSLNNLASLYQDQGRYSEAEVLFQQALKIDQAALGKSHPDMATDLNNLAALYQDQGRYGEAEPLYQQALKILQAALGESHPDVATSLNNLALLYQDQGRYSEAEPLYQQALKIDQAALDESHPAVATDLNNLAGLYYFQGRYSEAEPLFQQALSIRQAALGESHPDVATSLNNLALLYEDQGLYSEAEPLFQQALKIDQAALDESHPAVATDLNNLAGLYHSQGRYSEAEPLFQQVLSIRQAALGESHPDVATSLNNLALLYEDQGLYREAKPLFQQALSIRQAALGESHPAVADSLNNLGLLYYSQGLYREAKPLFQQALSIRQAALGESHPAVADSLNNLALLYEDQGLYREAKPLFQQALKTWQAALGETHPNVAISLNNLAILNWAQGYLQPALNGLQQGLAIEEANLNRNLIGGSESNKRDYLNTFNGSTDGTLTLHLQYLLQDPTATQLAVKTILQRKGRLLDLFTNSQQTLRNQLDPDSQALLDQLNQVHTQSSTLYHNQPETLPQAQYQQQLNQLNEQSQQLEDQLSRRSATFRATTAPVDLPALQSLLPADGVLVEFSRYQIFDPKAAADKRFGEYHYAAYLLQADGKIIGIDLGAAATIDPLIADFSVAVRSPSVRVAQVKAAAQALDAVLMAPIRSHLGNQKHLLISPDGPLNLIPFEALVDENDQYLIENNTLTYLTSGRDLLRLQSQSQSQQPPLLLADPFFGERSNSASNNTLIDDLRQRTFPPLRDASAEAKTIASHLPQSQLQEGTQATEAVIKQADRPSILHIATHGFFLPITYREGVPTENPLLRSGLLLAGFRNTASDGKDDGILTALETSNLNLLGTELVVFSACDTGQGDLSVGEGVYGLRRALVLAGSESQIISLWQVQDEPTKTLMVSYYERLLKGEGRSEALRNAQRAMLQDETTAHPYYWAPFIQSGDWRPLSSSSSPKP